MADAQPDLKQHVISIYTSRVEIDSFDWREIMWLIESVFSNEGFWDEPSVPVIETTVDQRMHEITDDSAQTEFDERKAALRLLEIIDGASIECPSTQDGILSEFISREQEWAFNQLQSLRKPALDVINHHTKALPCTVEDALMLLQMLVYAPSTNNFDMKRVPHPNALLTALLLHHLPLHQTPLENLRLTFSPIPTGKTISGEVSISLFAQGFDGISPVDSSVIRRLTLRVEAFSLEKLGTSVELPSTIIPQGPS